MVCDDPREFQKWLFEIGDVIDLFNCDPGKLETEANRMNRELARVFDSAEAFFLSRSHDLAVVYETR